MCRSLAAGATGRHAELGGRESAACGKCSEPRVGGKGRHSNGTERNLVGRVRDREIEMVIACAVGSGSWLSKDGLACVCRALLGSHRAAATEIVS